MMLPPSRMLLLLLFKWKVLYHVVTTQKQIIIILLIYGFFLLFRIIQFYLELEPGNGVIVIKSENQNELLHLQNNNKSKNT